VWGLVGEGVVHGVGDWTVRCEDCVGPWGVSED